MALQAARGATGLEISVSLSVARGPGGFRTPHGVTLADCLDALANAGRAQAFAFQKRCKNRPILNPGYPGGKIRKLLKSLFFVARFELMDHPFGRQHICQFHHLNNSLFQTHRMNRRTPRRGLVSLLVGQFIQTFEGVNLNRAELAPAPNV